jgi:nitrogen regulatory protein P-II 1
VKKIEAIIKPFKLDAVRNALCDAGLSGMTIIEVRGFGRQRSQTEIFRGSEYSVDSLPKIKLELVVADRLADRVVSIITQSAQTGKIGDGKIFVYTVERAVRIRTDEQGEDAL